MNDDHDAEEQEHYHEALEKNIIDECERDPRDNKHER
jgi:hypothetical protein